MYCLYHSTRAFARQFFFFDRVPCASSRTKRAACVFVFFFFLFSKRSTGGNSHEFVRAFFLYNNNNNTWTICGRHLQYNIMRLYTHTSDPRCSVIMCARQTVCAHLYHIFVLRFESVNCYKMRTIIVLTPFSNNNNNNNCK